MAGLSRNYTGMGLKKDGLAYIDKMMVVGPVIYI